MAICLLTFFLVTVTAGTSLGQGTQVQRPKGTTASPFGFYEYLPIGYDTDLTKTWPVLICLHGQGELGNGTTELTKAIVNGPGKEIKNGRHFPMIVVSPQSLYWWNATLIDNFIEYVKKTYRVDVNRVYLTGLSMGGIAAWEYTAKFPDKIAAMVAIAGNGNAQDPCQLAKVPIWAFHGDADGTVDKYGSINSVNAVNNCTNPVADPKALLTLYPGVGHDSWTRTYSGSAGHDIYSWMLQYSLSGTTNVPPTVSAGADKTVQLPTSTTVITGTATDSDGSIATYAWSKISGPSTTLTNQTTASLTASALVAGTYVFELKVTDNLGASASDQMTLVVKPAVTNQAPTANAGADLIITLPQTSVVITGSGTDTDGSIATYAWSQQSGAATTISDPTKAQITIGGLAEGVYVFRLTVTDDKGATGVDDVTITVNPAATNQKPTVSVGADLSVTLPQSTVVIKGTAADPDGSIAVYAWSKTSGPTATLENGATSEVTINSLIVGVYVFRLTVTDNAGEQSFDEVQVTVLDQVNLAPVASAGLDKVIVLPTNTINIIGSGTDTDGTVASYLWEVVSGPAADMVNQNTAVLTLNNLVEGVYVLSLTVTDDKGASDIDEVKVTVQSTAVNLLPTVSAGSNINVVMPIASVDIPATAQDADGTIQTYAWTKVSGGIVTLTNTNTSKLTVSDLVAGNYIFRITVTDNSGGEASDDVELIVSPETINKVPVVTASEDVVLTLPVNSTVLSATASDPDGIIVSYLWSKISGPAATLQDEATAFLNVTNLIEGTYVFRVTVTDDGGANASNDVTVTVKASGVQTCNCDHVIEANKEYINAKDMVPAVKPGDVICVRAGTRGYLRFLDFVGTAAEPLTFINCGGQVVINNPTVDGSLSFTRCKYFRVTGTGDPNYTYGFKIAVSTRNTAMFMSDSDFEVDHIEIANSGYAGIMCKIDPTCDNPQYHRGNFVMENLKLHDNYIHDVNGEAYYIGYYAYGGVDKGAPCGMVYPHDIKNVKVYNNIIRNTAADGLQITCATEGAEVYNNSIENYGLAPFSSDQNNGLILGGGTSGLCYNNYIRQKPGVPGVGMAVFALGGNIIFNNIIVDAQSHGIYCGPKASTPGRNFTFINNTIINPKLDGIRFESVNAQNSKFYNNIIVNPGTYDTYQNASFCAKGIDAFIYANCKLNGESYDSANNLFTRNINSVGFVDPANYDFRLKSTSRVIDLGMDVSSYGVNFDYYKLARPSNLLYDKGATEYQNDGSTNKVPSIAMPVNQTLTLPTNSTTLTASATDEDGTIASYLWTQTSGPNQATLTNANTKTLTASALLEGEYVFRLTVQDNLGASAFGEVKVTVKAVSTNQPPVASAGANKTITLPTNTAVLNGSGTDVDGTIATYQWSKVSGPAATMTNGSTANLSLSGLVAGVYVFKLTVTDNLGAQGSAQATLTVQPAAVNKPPVANAGGNKTLTLPNNSTTLIGSGSDADGSIAAYLWTKQSGPAATLGTANAANFFVSNLVEGIYVFRLTVTDNSGATAFSDATITVLPATAAKPPVVNAGADILVTLPTNTAVINGSASADGTITTYTWTKRSGPVATLVNDKTASLQLSGLVEGVYVFRLTVVDNNLLSAFDEVTVTVLPQNVNSIPVANAGGNKTVKLPDTSVTLTGSGSDADGSIVSYAWSQLTGVPVQLSSLIVPSLTISDLDIGVYSFRLTVTDDKGATATNDAVVTVVAAATNLSPVADAGVDIVIYLPANTVKLTGAGTDADGTIAGYLWTKISGPAVNTVNENTAEVTLEDLVEGSYTFRLTVSDNQGASGVDEVNVTVLPETVNQAPIADAGPDVSVRLPQIEVVVQGSGSDPDGQITTYAWTQKSGDALSVSGAATTTLTVSNLKPGGYIFELRVTDNKGEVATDEMEIVILAERAGPEAYAGVDTVVNMPVDEIQLVGLGTVVEGSITEYLWEKKSGPDVVLSNFETSVLDLTSIHSGEYLFAFTVTDDQGVSDTDDVMLKVTEDLFAPKVFTPNGDGQNDFWQIKNVDLVQGCPLAIYDKLGNMVYEADSYGNDWDGIGKAGKYKGHKLEPGAYYYVFKCSDSKVVTGGVRIIR